jgi:hypothetical protein
MLPQAFVIQHRALENKVFVEKPMKNDPPLTNFISAGAKHLFRMTWF